MAVEEYGTAKGPADYALCDGGTVRAVVEAKKVTLGPQGVLIQAERYSKGIGQLPLYQDEFGVPCRPAGASRHLRIMRARQVLKHPRR